VDVIVEKLGEDVLLLDIRPLSTIADYFVICQAATARQMRAVHEEVLTQLKETGVRALHSEGAPASGWVLVDYGSVIVHIFLPLTRSYYDLEQLWKDAKTVVRIQ
jgi:ribosome-associated protein